MTVSTPALDRRAAAVAALDDPFDVLVIGGGVNGLAIAWDAALAGLRTVVVEKGDWGSGTSSWSSRMIHGGLKYLEKYDVRLVREALRDREWLLQRAPHLVTPLPFVLPFYDRNQYPPLMLRAGMIAYDALSLDKSVPRHETFSRKEIIRRLPGISGEGLKGGARYYDAQVEYAERMCTELMLGARGAGAVTLNHTRVTHVDTEGNRVVGATVVDELTGAEHRIRADATVNVTGAWVDDVVAGTSAESRRWIGGTKGTHLVVDPFEGAPADSMYYESEDGRPMMVIPWLGMYLIGSTDKRFSGDLDTVSADEEEIEYILRETNRLFPAADLTDASIRYAYTGVRPAPVRRRRADRRHQPPARDPRPRPRRGRALQRRRWQADDVPGPRQAHAEDPAQADAGRPVPAGRAAVPRCRDARHAAERPRPEVRARLVRLYGSRADRVVALAGGDRSLLEPLAAPPEGVPAPVDGMPVAAEVLLAVREEEALHLADVLARRTMVGLHADLGRSAAEATARVMAPELGWSEEDIAIELKGYETYLRRFEPPWRPATEE